MSKEDELYIETPSAIADDSLTLNPLSAADILSSSSKQDFASPDLKTGILVSAIGIGMFMGALDESIINVSLPTISNYFMVDQLRVQWIVLSYLLVIVGLTALAGYLGDRFSTKMVFQIGMIIFSIGSLVCALSNSLPMLVVARIIQGVGATGTLANGNAIVTKFTTDEKRGLAIGLTSLISAMGVVIGPIIGGTISQYLPWQYIFWINVPIGLVGIIYVQFGIPATKPSEKAVVKADPVGSIIFALFITLLILALALFVDPLLNRPILWAIICFSLSTAFFAIFIFWEKKTPHPFIDLTLFKNKKFSIGIICALITYISLNSVAFQLPFFLQDMLNYTQIKIGLIIIGVPIGLAIMAPISGKLSSTIDSRLLSTIGLGAVLLCLICLATFLSLTMPLWSFILIATVVGLAIGLFASPNNNSILSSSPKEKLGIVSGLVSLARIIGYSIGTALSTTIFTFILQSFQNTNGGALYDAMNYIPSMRILFGILSAFVVIAVSISALRGPEIRMNQNKDVISMPSEEANPLINK